MRKHTLKPVIALGGISKSNVKKVKVRDISVFSCLIYIYCQDTRMNIWIHCVMGFYLVSYNNSLFTNKLNDIFSNKDER